MAGVIHARFAASSLACATYIGHGQASPIAARPPAPEHGVARERSERRSNHVRCCHPARLPARARPVATRERHRRGVGPAHARLEPSRGALHRRPAQGRRERLLHVPQLRAGPRGLRGPGRQLHPAAGCLRRSQLLQAGRECAVRDPRRQRRRRAREPHVPVPVPERERRQPAHGRRQAGLDPAGAERRQGREPAQRPGAQRARDVHRRRRPRPAPYRQPRSR